MDKQELLKLATTGVNICDDSRKILPGDIFIAVDGTASNGGDYISQAIDAGCQYVACSKETAFRFKSMYPAVSFVIWENTRDAAWELAKARYGSKQNIKVIGITGTNGKTTSVALLECLLQNNGCATGIIGTINYHWDKKVIPAALTTPGPLILHELLNEMEKDSIEWAIMEVSSHALAQMRIGGITFSGALFTNLTQDHLDFHSDMESYFAAKASLFYQLPSLDKPCAINSDDPYGKRLAKKLPQAITYGLETSSQGGSHLQGKIIKSDRKGLELKMTFAGMDWNLKSPLVGSFNAMNLLGAQALGLALGFHPNHFSCLENFTGVSGRLERIFNKKDLHIFVDYAHTPDALIKAQKALKDSEFERLIVVFGCGGNRDRSKRPLMGNAVAQYADIAIVTSDNPRREDPNAIIADVLPGICEAKQFLVEPDRKKAIMQAISLMGPQDALLIAGKGHEDYQILGDKKIHFSDQEVVREFLR